nr:MAG TPA: hypothetical protein [Caudoviricetes sp.]
MAYFKWLNLQLFADGDGSGDGSGAASVESPADDGQEAKLLALGVPADKIRKRANKPAVKVPDGAIMQDGQAAAVREQPKQEEAPKEEPKPRMSWEEVKADPDLNAKLQSVIQERLKSSKGAEDALSKLAPAIEVLARNYGMDPQNLDYDALSQAINNDDLYYEQKALSMGVDAKTAKELDQKERDNARKQREEAATIERQRIEQHIAKLEQQGEAMKQTFPNFNLRQELMNPAFARMTSPNVGISVEDAYYAIHRKEIQTAAMQVTAQKAAQKLSNSIQAGSRRPDEAGASSQAPSVTTFDYSKATKEQRDAIKKRIREAAARGEKLYPGR